MIWVGKGLCIVGFLAGLDFWLGWVGLCWFSDLAGFSRYGLGWRFCWIWRFGRAGVEIWLD